MTGNRPDNYSLNNEYVRDVSHEHNNSEEVWELSFEAEGWPKTTVTFFPERDGIKIDTSDSPDYKEGKERAILGLVLLHIIRSGESVVKEL